jgi:hypothetical protein
MKKLLLNISAFLLINVAFGQTVESQFKYILTSMNDGQKVHILPHTNKVIEICPKPEKTLVALEANETNIIGPAFLYIYDLLGNRIYNQSCHFEVGACEKINLSHLQKGVYFLHVSNHTTSITRKIILE